MADQPSTVCDIETRRNVPLVLRVESQRIGNRPRRHHAVRSKQSIAHPFRTDGQAVRLTQIEDTTQMGRPTPLVALGRTIAGEVNRMDGHPHQPVADHAQLVELVDVLQIIIIVVGVTVPIGIEKHFRSLRSLELRRNRIALIVIERIERPPTRSTRTMLQQFAVIHARNGEPPTVVRRKGELLLDALIGIGAHGLRR